MERDPFQADNLGVETLGRGQVVCVDHRLEYRVRSHTHPPQRSTRRPPTGNLHVRASVGPSPGVFRQALLGAEDPYKALKTTLKAEIDVDAWETLCSDTSRPFDNRPPDGSL